MDSFSPTHTIQGLSHLNIVVDDIEKATAFYGAVLGFEPAANQDGPMDYPGVDLASFARNAGFADGKLKLDIRFLKHPEVGIYVELMRYHHPKGSAALTLKQTHDLGGIRHVAFTVDNAEQAYRFIRQQQERYAAEGLQIRIVGEDHVPEWLAPYPYKFFYWIDPWGVQWEMEEGRRTDQVIKGILG